MKRKRPTSFAPDYDRLSLENLHQLRRLCDRGDPERLAAIDAAISKKLGKTPGGHTAKGGARAGIAHETPEKSIVSPECDAALERLGFDVVKFDQPFRTAQTPGISDRYVRHPGFGWRAWIEYKYGDNKPTQAQREFQRIEREAGGIAFVVWNVEDLIEGLRSNGFPGPLPEKGPAENRRESKRRGRR